MRASGCMFKLSPDELNKEYIHWSRGLELLCISPFIFFCFVDVFKIRTYTTCLARMATIHGRHVSGSLGLWVSGIFFGSLIGPQVLYLPTKFCVPATECQKTLPNWNHEMAGWAPPKTRRLHHGETRGELHHGETMKSFTVAKLRAF